MALTLSDVKFWEAMGEEISIHTAFFGWHLKIALPSFYGIPTNASIIFSTFCATNFRSCEGFFDDYVLISLKLIACRICVFLSGLLGVKICLSHAQIGLF